MSPWLGLPCRKNSNPAQPIGLVNFSHSASCDMYNHVFIHSFKDLRCSLPALWQHDPVLETGTCRLCWPLVTALYLDPTWSSCFWLNIAANKACPGIQTFSRWVPDRLYVVQATGPMSHNVSRLPAAESRRISPLNARMLPTEHPGANLCVRKRKPSESLAHTLILVQSCLLAWGEWVTLLDQVSMSSDGKLNLGMKACKACVCTASRAAYGLL